MSGNIGEQKFWRIGSRKCWHHFNLEDRCLRPYLMCSQGRRNGAPLFHGGSNILEQTENRSIAKNNSIIILDKTILKRPC